MVILFLALRLRRYLQGALKKSAFFLVLLLDGGSVLAAEITCSSGGNPAPLNVEISPAKVTVSSHITDYTVLYTFQSRIVGDVSAYCFSTPAGGNPAFTANTLTNVLGPADSSRAGYLIFPTNVAGIGISVNSMNAGNAAIPAWPAYLLVNTSPMGNTWRHQNVTIRIWKIPGDITTTASPLGIIGPTVIQGIMPATGSDYLDPTIMTSDRMLSPDFWIISQRSLSGSANFYVGTCNLRNSHQTVLLGKHMNFKRKSDWRDASFIIDCPVPAYGYGGANNTTVVNRNKAPSIKLVPYNMPVVTDDLGNPLSGTLSLDPGGAVGYGVQLAWGDYAALSSATQPAKPVLFDFPFSVSTLVSGYASTIPLNSTAPSATIRMAARFIQIEAIPQAGNARASVEVIVNYE